MSKPERIGSILEVVDRLLGDGGCPWDREQTLESLRPYVVEEAFEVVEAIDRGSPEAIREEIGDLLFQVVFLSRLTEQRFGFDLGGIADAIAQKMIRRHPWVFGDETVHDAADAIATWEAQKAKERKAAGRLSGVPSALPALLRAYRIGEKASAVGYDWPDARGTRAKIDEELAELDAAVESGESEAIELELGDLLFALASHGRKLGVDSESALRRALDRFSNRFRACETLAEREGANLAELDDAAREVLWQRAKRGDGTA